MMFIRLLVVAAIVSAGPACVGPSERADIVDIAIDPMEGNPARSVAVHGGSSVARMSISSDAVPLVAKFWWRTEYHGELIDSKPIVVPITNASQDAYVLLTGLGRERIAPGERIGTLVLWNGDYSYLNAPKDRWLAERQGSVWNSRSMRVGIDAAESAVDVHVVEWPYSVFNAGEHDAESASDESVAGVMNVKLMVALRKDN